MVDKINKTDPDLKVQPAHVKNHLTVFVNALVENPSFDSQTKETLTTRPRNFGSDCQLSTQLLDNILERTRIVDTVRRRDLLFCVTHHGSLSVRGLLFAHASRRCWVGN